MHMLIFKNPVSGGMTRRTPVLVVSGVSSGVGKTSVTIGIMAALTCRGMRVQPFKVGPDYLDTMHHTIACGGLPSVNLDGYMMGRDGVLESFDRNCHASHADIAVVEGCMGLFDGRDGHTDCGSTAEIAKWLGAPVVLVVDAWCLGRSAAAMTHGYASFDPDVALAGVVFNKIGGESHATWLRDAITSSMFTRAIPVLGCLPKNANVVLPERHLGLHMPTEASNDSGAAVQDLLRSIVEAHMDMDMLVRAATASALPPTKSDELPRPSLDMFATLPPNLPPVRFGVAKDAAFCFYYHDNLHLLEMAGATLVYFSPIHDHALPRDLHGLVFGGGYPELHAAALDANATMRASIRAFAAAGGLIYAECGGLMYLAQHLHVSSTSSHAMVGLLPFDATMTPRMTMGYCEATPSPALARLLHLPHDLVFRCHQFHFSEATLHGAPLERVDAAGRGVGWKGVADAAYLSTMVRAHAMPPAPEGIVQDATIASYCHIHFGASPALPLALVHAARRRMRIVSFESSATEILGAVWTTPLDGHATTTTTLRGVSEFCDHPPWLVAPLPRLTRSLITATTSEAIEAQVQALHAAGVRNLHEIDTTFLASARPDIVFTQDACDRCATTESALARALDTADLPWASPVVCRPLTIAAILAQVEHIGHAVGEPDRGMRLRASLDARLAAVHAQVAAVDQKVRVLGLESAFPLVASGQWLPDMRARAGAVEALTQSSVGCPPRRLDWTADVLLSAPDVLVVACCGKTARQSASEVARHMSTQPGFWDLPAMQTGQLYVIDHDVLSRPGPRVVDGVEILAMLFYPDAGIAVHNTTAAVLQYVGPLRMPAASMVDDDALWVTVLPKETMDSVDPAQGWQVTPRTRSDDCPGAMAAHTVVVHQATKSLVLLAGDSQSKSLSRRMWRYEPTTTLPWTALDTTTVYGEEADVPTDRSNHAAAIWRDDVLVVFGGWDDAGLRPLAALELLDLRTNCWTHGSTVGTPPSARANPSLVVHDNRAIVFGGWDGHTRFNDVVCLDLTTWRWTRGALRDDTEVPAPRTDHSAVWWPKGEAMVVFGGTSVHGPLDDVWLLREHAWTRMTCTGDVLPPRTSHAAVLVQDHIMLVTGGQSPTSSVFDTCYALDLQTQMWTRVVDLPSRVCRHAMAVLDNVVYLYGGYDGARVTSTMWSIACGDGERGSNTPSQAIAAVDATREEESVASTPAATSWAPSTPLTWADIEADAAFADDVVEIDEMEDEDQPSERYRLLHRVACARGYVQYVDPTSGYTVFTSIFLQDRACCGYRCRHCPWGHKNVPKHSTVNATLEW
ncbi:Aste57867_11309 [Aphanomyces stellatus]|uniref:Aste57867_11309 protein n=1 Tax=Aphanomyces stellatus TaxID=120398 RepID=A0A485KSJ9_9STRA|nr:hypothetical protein As57867_011267 [Aphanomyces stellatus]VFT88171.1 Aste57867_11309 [Aphanomyces stellatus]